MNKNKFNHKKEYGDFQTPLELAQLMVDIIKSNNILPDVVFEPTCGVGNILFSTNLEFPKAKSYGIEINQTYCENIIKATNEKSNIEIFNADFFQSEHIIKAHIKGKNEILFIGNPPWVTNSEISGFGGKNFPKKCNIKNLRGIDAITGKSNFDICEYIILKLIEWFHSENLIIAFLCKTIVARNLLKYCWENSIYYKDASIFPIDSQKYFSAAVDACYFIINFTEKKKIQECTVYDSIERPFFSHRLGFYNNKMIVDMDKFKSHNYLGKCDYTWRNGIKHDCAKVMELTIIDDKLVNGYDEIVDIEEELLYPLLKSSDIANGNLVSNKMVIIPQKQIGEDTTYIKFKYPRT
jgi:hypothetical protein